MGSPTITRDFKRNLADFAEDGYRFSHQHSLFKDSQQAAYQAYLQGVSEDKRHGYIELPTGVGKTALFIALIKNYLDAANGSENAPRVLIAVPTEKLAVQTAQAFAKFLPDIARTLEADDDKGQEIDWEKSDIGLQYGKMKHAHKKPKVLITTYQSLTRDTQNTTYPPQDYGFVIYDEGHVITAPSFGKATDKFKDAIQLAVTATPEYTKEKTVAARLPNLYYRLPLAEAINNGDLCNVRPAIVKTGYKIDEALFQRFMEQQWGTPLNENQLQQLLNRESRNKAVVETYMRGADPDSHERYFGQNGMIFCTGVKHADAIAAQFGKALEKGEGRKLGAWLDGEGIELVAPVHGQIKGAWLKKGLLADSPAESRQYQGSKEWYSEQEIFDLHEKGKILLLASVAKLKVGYDSPRDSLLFDLADRFSKVDATQIDGRAFRRDPENPDKTATVFNLMDENTQALYEKYPKMMPIYCAEVIEGAKFRPPARRNKAQIRFKEPPPGMEQSLQQAGFDVVTNIDTVRTISRNNKAKREAALIKAPEKTSEWLSITEMSAIVRRETRAISPLYKSLQTSWEEAKRTGGKTFTADGITLTVDKAGVRKTKTLNVFCIHQDAIPQFQSVPEKTGDWVGLKEMGDLTQRNPMSISHIYKSLESAWKSAKENGEDSFTAEGITLSTSRAGIFRSHSRITFCVHKDALPQFQSTTSQKPTEWIGITDMANHCSKSLPTISKIYKSLQSSWEKAKINGASYFSAGGITLSTDQADIFKNHTHTTFCLHPLAVSQFQDAPEKTEEWLGAKEFAKRVKKDAEKVICPLYKSMKMAWEDAKRSEKEIFTTEGITLPVDKAEMRKTKTITIFCLHEDAIDRIRDHFSASGRGKSSFAEKVGGPQSIVPGSPNLNRLDRERGNA